MTARPNLALGPLIKIGWRSIRTAKLRSLLVFTLIAFVVAAGTFAAIVNRSTGTSDDDRRLAEFGASNFRADFAGRYAPINPPVIVSPPAFNPGNLPIPVQQETPEELQARNEAEQEWLANFDGRAVALEIEQALGVDVSLVRASFVGQSAGPFGSRRAATVGQFSDLDVSHPANRGAINIIEGRAPNATNEIALNYRDGDTLRTVGDTIQLSDIELTVVGLVANPAHRWDAVSLVTAATFDAVVGPQDEVTFSILARLPDDELAAEKAASVVTEIVGRTIDARTPNSVLVRQDSGWQRYSDFGDGWHNNNAVPAVWPILLSGLLATQIALVCAATFAVGIRRRTREFGQLMALGADDRHIRRLALVEAALLGVVAAIVGLVIGVTASSIALDAGWLDTAGNRLPDGIRWSIVDWLGPAAIGIIAVVVAAWWPTRVLTSAPIPAVLEGQLPSIPVRKATPRWGVVLVLIGTVSLGLGAEVSLNGSSQVGASSTLLALGIIIMIAGSVLLIGTVLSIVGRRADRMPLLARLAVRNSDRQRSRSWVVVGAFIAALAVPVLIGASIKAYPSSYSGREVGALDGRLLTTTSSDLGSVAVSAASYSDELAAFDTEFGRLIDDTFPIAAEAPMVVTKDFEIVWSYRNQGSYSTGGSLVIATDKIVDLLDISDDLVADLDAGKVVDISTYADPNGGQPRLMASAARGVGIPIEVVAGPPLLGNSTWLVSARMMQDRDASLTTAGTIRLLEAPMTIDEEETVRQLGNTLWVEQLGPFNPQFGTANYQPWLNMRVDRTYSSGPSAGTVRLWSTLVAIGLALLVALVTSALSAVEMTPEIESMIATGANPSIRRQLLGAQTLYHLVIAAAFAIPLALLAFWVVTQADTNRFSPGFTLPWLSLAITAILIPVLVAIAITAIFRNGKPAISRRMS